jgi:DNA-binding PadR family transcriptional regulator
MSLTYTMLGFLNQGPLTGYELKKIIDSSTQNFWHAELSQIYPVLKEMERKQWVAVRIIEQAGKPDKKEYSITPAGRAALLDWLREPLDEIPATKSPLLLKLFFIGELDREELLAQLRCQSEIQRARLKRYQSESRELLAEAQASRVAPQKLLMWELVREYGERQARSSLDWLENAIQRIQGEK